MVGTRGGVVQLSSAAPGRRYRCLSTNAIPQAGRWPHSISNIQSKKHLGTNYLERKLEWTFVVPSPHLYKLWLNLPLRCNYFVIIMYYFPDQTLQWLCSYSKTKTLQYSTLFTFPIKFLFYWPRLVFSIFEQAVVSPPPWQNLSAGSSVCMGHSQHTLYPHLITSLLIS